jgi:CheY-like chemotaxis protein
MMAHRHTALVVEDEPAIRELIVDVLAQEGFAAHQAEDGAEALRLLEQRPHDYCVMLLDCMLPTVAGVEVLRYLRRHDAGVPVIAMSASQGHHAEAIRPRSPDRGGDGPVCPAGGDPARLLAARAESTPRLPRRRPPGR